MRRRGRAKLAPRGFSPLSDFSHGRPASQLSADKGRAARIAEVPLTGVKRIIEADTDILHFLSVLFFSQSKPYSAEPRVVTDP